MPAFVFLLAILGQSDILSAQFTPLPTFPVTLTTPYRLPGALGAPDEVAFLTANGADINVLSYASGSPVLVWTSTLPLAASTGAIIGGDLNGDNLTDIVVVHPFNTTVLHRTAAGFTVAQGPTANTMIYFKPNLQLVDWEGDNDLDLMHGPSMMLNDGTGQFGGQAVVAPSAGGYVDSFAGDVDGDGDIDYLLTSGAGNATTQLFLRSGGNLVPGPSWPAIDLIDSRFLDVNLDGILDVWTINVTSTSVTTNVALGLGNGAFGPMNSYLVPSSFPVGMALSVDYPDIDGDGCSEIVVSGSGGILNPTGNSYVYDIDVSGSIVALPFPGTVLAGLLTTLAADLNGDSADDLIGYIPSAPFSPSGVLSPFVSPAPPMTHQITVVSGAGQSTSSADTTMLPVVVDVVTNATGLPSVGLGMSVSTTGGMTISAPSGLTTDANGRIQFFVTGGSATGPQVATVTYGNSSSLPISFNVVPAAGVTIISGGVQAGFLNGAPLAAIVAEARRPDGSPWVGGTIHFTSSAALSLPVGSTAVTTDSLGQASVTPTILATGMGVVTAAVASGPLASTANATIGARRFAINHTAGTSNLIIFYVHEDGPTPFLLAADFPRAPTPTAFGNVATSILSPLPGLAVLDGLGYLGPPNATIVANPSFTRVVGGISPTLFGTALVFQAYGFDFSYPYPQSIFISPALNVTL